MKVQFLLLPAVLGSWWNPITWYNTVADTVDTVVDTVVNTAKETVNTVKETVTPTASVKSDSYAHTKLDSTSEILNSIGLDNVWLKYNVDLSPKTRHAIKWTQHNRCMGYCIENYWEFYYYEEHDEKQLPIKVFVADEYVTNGAPPKWIHTQNAYRRLYMAYFPIDYAKPKEDHAAIFVYQPSENDDDREIYQKRFHMGMNDLVEKAIGALGTSAGLAAGASVGATVGATVGSIVPVAGTAVGGAVGAAIGAAGGLIGGYGATHFTNNYTGDFLRFVG